MAAFRKIDPVRTVLLHWRAAVREAHATVLEKKRAGAMEMSKLTCHPTKHILPHCTMATFLQQNRMTPITAREKAGKT